MTTTEVAAITINGGPPLKTNSDSLLPPELRAVVWKMADKNAENFQEPRIVALNAHGEAMPNARPKYKFFTELLSKNVPVGAVNIRTCAIDARAITGLKAQGESVVTELHGIAGLLGDAFLSCAKAQYELSGWPMSASVLVDASHPGLTPRGLPAMKMLSGRHDVIEAPGQEGPQVARRIKHGWLIVSGGRDQAQRVVLLEHLRARVLAGGVGGVTGNVAGSFVYTPSRAAVSAAGGLAGSWLAEPALEP